MIICPLWRPKNRIQVASFRPRHKIYKIQIMSRLDDSLIIWLLWQVTAPLCKLTDLKNICYVLSSVQDTWRNNLIQCEYIQGGHAHVGARRLNNTGGRVFFPNPVVWWSVNSMLATGGATDISDGTCVNLQYPSSQIYMIYKCGGNQRERKQANVGGDLINNWTWKGYI